MVAESEYKEFIVTKQNYYTSLCSEPLPEGSQMLIYFEGNRGEEGVWSDTDIFGNKIAGEVINEYSLRDVIDIKYRIPIK